MRGINLWPGKHQSATTQKISKRNQNQEEIVIKKQEMELQEITGKSCRNMFSGVKWSKEVDLLNNNSCTKKPFKQSMHELEV